MNSIPSPDPSQLPEHFDDPRTAPGFLPHHYPAANGKAAPPVGAVEQNERITLEFLAAYYHLNCAYARVIELRKQPKSPDRLQAERACLQEIEKGLIVRDRLEDHYASYGVITDPASQNGFTRNVKFSFGNVDAAGQIRRDFYTLTAFVPIPLPREVKVKDLPMKIEGPGFDGDY
jgi:hypothetical protein